MAGSGQTPLGDWITNTLYPPEKKLKKALTGVEQQPAQAADDMGLLRAGRDAEIAARKKKLMSAGGAQANPVTDYSAAAALGLR